MMRSVRSELLKLRTTNVWWLFAIVAFVLLALAFLSNAVTAHFNLVMPDFGTPDPSAPPEAVEQMHQDQQRFYDEQHTPAALATMTANLLTSGQFFGLLLVMLLGVLIVTNEFFHQTATTTFLTVPHRTQVIVAKLIAGVSLAGVFWLVTAMLNYVATTVFLNAEGITGQFGQWTVQRAVLSNLLAYALWAVLGIGLGVLIRSQIGAVVTATVIYMLSIPAALITFNLIHQYLIKKDWVLDAMVVVPGVASSVMVSQGEGLFEHPPQWWVGALVLTAYGVVAGVIGTLVTRKRDIS